jgi:hypothetical protein
MTAVVTVTRQDAQTTVKTHAAPWNWRYCMPGSANPMDADRNWESRGTTYQVMYLVKRPSYNFIFAIPQEYPLFRNANRAILQVCVKGRRQPPSFVLNLEELKDFYDGLSHLVEYIRAEREKRYTQL